MRARYEGLIQVFFELESDFNGNYCLRERIVRAVHGFAIQNRTGLSCYSKFQA